MPPKRPSKRRGDEEDSRPSKKGGKKNKEPTYDTYDECLDGESSPLFFSGTLRSGGVEMEEKGERYRDGDKVSLYIRRSL